MYGLLHPRSESNVLCLESKQKSLMLDEGEVPLNVQGISMYYLSYRAPGWHAEMKKAND